MKRTRAFRRKMRKKWMKHRRTIANTYGGWDCPDGMFAKGKVHCSCGICSAKTRNKSFKRRKVHGNYAPNLNWKHSDKLKLDSMDYQEEHYQNNEDDRVLQLKMEYDEPDWTDANVDGVTLDGVPLDGHYLDHLIDGI